MTREELLSNLYHFFEAPGGLQSFRRLVVNLAIRGALTPKANSRDCLAKLLEQIRAARKERPSRAPSVPVTREEIPVIGAAVPFVRLSEVARLEKGETGIQSAEPGQYPLVGLAAERSTCSQYQIDAKAAVVPLISSSGHGHASMKRLHYQEGKFALANILCAVIPLDPDNFSARFIYEYLSAYKEALLVSQMVGTANMSLTLGKVGTVPFPLVCTGAQVQVEALMKLCDRYEIEQANREARRDKLVAGSLQQLSIPSANNSNGENSFQENARFYFNHLPRLTTRAEHIQQLRRTLFNLAVWGRLVHQDPADEPASLLLAKIDNARRQFLSKGFPNKDEAKVQLKKQCEQGILKDLQPLPVGWKWATLMQCAALVVDCHNKTAPYISSGIPLIRTSNIRNGALVLSDLRYVSEETFVRWSARCEPIPGDILITREAPMGEVAQIPDDLRICMGQRLMLIRLIPGTISPKFLLYSLQDPLLLERVQDKPVGATVQHLRVGGVESLLVPVPPAREQHRIVSKLEELMLICSNFERMLRISAAVNHSLLQATLQQALTPTADRSEITTGA